MECKLMIQPLLTLSVFVRRITECFILAVPTVKSKTGGTSIAIMFHLSCLILKNLKLCSVCLQIRVKN